MGSTAEFVAAVERWYTAVKLDRYLDLLKADVTETATTLEVAFEIRKGVSSDDIIWRRRWGLDLLEDAKRFIAPTARIAHLPPRFDGDRRLYALLINK